MPKKPNAPETIVHSVRLSLAEKSWLDEQAKANGFELQQLIRFAIEALRSSVEWHDGQLIVPVRIKQWFDRATKVREDIINLEHKAILEGKDATLTAVTNERDHLRAVNQALTSFVCDMQDHLDKDLGIDTKEPHATSSSPVEKVLIEADTQRAATGSPAHKTGKTVRARKASV